MPAWQDYLGEVERSLKSRRFAAQSSPSGGNPVQHRLSSSRTKNKIVLELLSRTRKKNGEWTVPKDYHVSPDQAALLPDPVDVEAITAMFGGEDIYSYYSYNGGSTRKALGLPIALKLLPAIAGAGRLFYRDHAAARLETVTWDTGEPWVPWLELRQDERDQWTITGFLRRGEERMAIDEPQLLLAEGLMLARKTVSRFEPGGGFGWLEQLRHVKRIPFPDRDRDAVLSKLLAMPALPPMEIDEALRFDERKGAPRLGLRIRQERTAAIPRYVAQFMLDYGAGWMDGMSEGRGVWRPEERVYLVRDKQVEDGAREKLTDLGLRTDPYRPDHWLINTKSLPRTARELIGAGWHVEAEGKLFRSPGATRVSVKSGIDWFELHGEVTYGDTTVSLPALLAAVRRGDSMVLLGDGSFGLLPEEWLQRFAPLAGMGEKERRSPQVPAESGGLLDALLAAQPEVDSTRPSRAFASASAISAASAAEQPAGFVGQLRHYQLEGLGWMAFLREFGFGGCLADDMGVGKTAQVLATLEARRSRRQRAFAGGGPKSVMFNWRQEATRFTPKLRVLEYRHRARRQQIPA